MTTGKVVYQEKHNKTFIITAHFNSSDQISKQLNSQRSLIHLSKESVSNDNVSGLGKCDSLEKKKKKLYFLKNSFHGLKTSVLPTLFRASAIRSGSFPLVDPSV